MRMWFTGKYREVVEHHRLVYTDAPSDERGNVLTADDLDIHNHPTMTEVAIDLEDHGDRTRMVMTYTGVPAESSGAVAWNVAFDKLTSHIEATNRN
jgi:uncharacterized protein YndB with AHSA1/START domain